MRAVAEKPKRARVTVIGITNQMDYFNKNYESQQQISGLLVAENGQELFILTEYRVVAIDLVLMLIQFNTLLVLKVISAVSSI